MGLAVGATVGLDVGLGLGTGVGLGSVGALVIRGAPTTPPLGWSMGSLRRRLGFAWTSSPIADMARIRRLIEHSISFMMMKVIDLVFVQALYFERKERRVVERSRGSK